MRFRTLKPERMVVVGKIRYQTNSLYLRVLF